MLHRNIPKTEEDNLYLEADSFNQPTDQQFSEVLFDMNLNFADENQTQDFEDVVYHDFYEDTGEYEHLDLEIIQNPLIPHRYYYVEEDYDINNATVVSNGEANRYYPATSIPQTVILFTYFMSLARRYWERSFN